MKAITFSANAKINLHLEVLNKREDGFHNIVSVFHPVSIADEITVQKTGRFADSVSSGCNVYSPLLRLPVVNTITNAYKQFSLYTGVNEEINVMLLKRIPAGAGLGGGSSDAAGLLIALNELFSTELSLSQLTDIALKIGSDVPFFLINKAAIVTGRGENIQPVNIENDYFGILVYPEIEISSSYAYSFLDKKGFTHSEPFNPIAFCSLDCSKWKFFNSFEKYVFTEFDTVAKLKTCLLSLGADFALMSGSGSSVFGLFKTEEHAINAYKTLLKLYKQVFMFLLSV